MPQKNDKHEGPRYVIITPARNEERYIEQTLEGVIHQTIQPVEWLIVNDGSTDSTGAILERYQRKFPWICRIDRYDRGSRDSSTGAIEAFHYGRQLLTTEDWQFLVNLDSDIELPPTYFHDCFEEFRKDPGLGIGGGTLYSVHSGTLREEANPLHHVRGATKIYRRSCWEQIGGLAVSPGWDTIDEVKANLLGWRTRSFPSIRGLHQRPTGGIDGAWSDNVKNGRADYVVGYHPAFMILKCIKRLLKRPYVIGSLGLLCGYVRAHVNGTPRFADEASVRYLRRQHLRRLFPLGGIWR